MATELDKIKEAVGLGAVKYGNVSPDVKLDYKNIKLETDPDADGQHAKSETSNVREKCIVALNKPPAIDDPDPFLWEKINKIKFTDLLYTNVNEQ